MTSIPFGPQWDGMTHAEVADALATIPDPEHDDTPPAPRPLSPAEQRARFLTIDDPWEPCLVRGACIECGATRRHAGACTHRGGSGYTPPTSTTGGTP